MRFCLFYHSLVSDWNHGNAHFLRGVTAELLARGHHVDVLEPIDGWSRGHLLRHAGAPAVAAFEAAYPGLRSQLYDPDSLDLDRLLDGCDVVLVHEWNEPSLVARIGRHRRVTRDHVLLFHDTHHRSVSAPEQLERYDLSDYDGVLAFGEVIRQGYLARGWSHRVFTWHEAADTRRFHPRWEEVVTGDLVWVGNWGDGERSAELYEYLLDPAARLGLRTRAYGVRWPEHALEALRARRIEFGGWLPNFEVPRVFARHRVTMHVPRRPYVRALPGIPTIRMFEALACGIPLVSAWWDDAEGLFRPGRDYLVAHNGKQAQQHLRELLGDRELRAQLARDGQATILTRHTCAHRVDELLGIVEALRPRPLASSHAAE